VVCIAVLSGSYLAVLHELVTVVGGVGSFLTVATAAAGLGVLFGGVLSRRAATGAAAAVLVAGLFAYLFVVPGARVNIDTVARAVGDTVSLLTGFSVFQIARADVWALAVTPGPTFLTWYLVARGDHVRATTVAALALGFFVLTGDSTLVGTLVGVAAAAGALGFDTLARVEAGPRQLEVFAAALALVVLAPTMVSAVPGGGASPITPTGGGSQVDLVSAGDRADIGGSLSPSPTVRWTVEADRAAYWRVSAYDRFTGDGWVRTGGQRATGGELDEPPGNRTPVSQTFTAQSAVDVLPAAAEPYRVSGIDASVTDQGTLSPGSSLEDGESYSVTSLYADPSPATLQDAGTDYPEPINETYRQLPTTTPDRVSELTDRITQTADTPYETATAVERWLEANKAYSLDVREPGGNAVDAFLFGMDSGYCVYYASAMVAMLRDQGVPARYVVGYTPGQRVAEDEWVVRGLDAHAWVEVYFPEVGWVTFDPTPADPRSGAEQSALEEARSDGGSGQVDAAGSEDGTYTTTTTTETTTDTGGQAAGSDGLQTTDNFAAQAIAAAAPESTTQNASPGGAGTPSRTTTGGDASTGGGFEPPSPRTAALWAVLAVGLVAGARRSGLADRAYRSAWLRVQPDADPGPTVEGAFARVEYVLGRRTRRRRPDETVREYLEAVDAGERARRVAAIRERARYVGEVTEEEAAEARELAREVVADAAS
jgi:transglutaminase-like putative cysteine protease